uniref:CCHC-type domain-containing protein n=1 Tax=Tanacetum cinerariifolium TaxID=118510 RepID=A0A6L2NI64_TANCI|nr:hypothetical protein [Tanacetum cinerariifolium]
MKRTRRDHDERVIILPPTNAEEHIAIQRESKARTTLLESIPDDHVADFHYMDDARDIWNAIKARGIVQRVALTLKTKGGLEVLSFDDLYYKLKMLEVDVKGYSTFSSSQSAEPSHSAFVSATSTSKKMSYGDSPNYSSSTTYSVPSNSKTVSHRSGNVIEDVLQSFVANTDPEQQLAYKDLEQIEKLDLEEMDLKWKMAMLSVRVHKFEQKAGWKIDFDKKESARFNKKKVRCYKCQQRGHFSRECRANGGNDKQRYSSFKIKEIGKKEEDSKALITVDTLVDWTNHDSESDGVIAAKEFGDAGEFAFMGVTSEVHNCPFGCDSKYNELKKQYDELNEQNNEYFIQDQAYKNSLKTLEKQKRVLQRNQLTLENKIRVLSIELENTSNLLKHSERINADVETAKKDLQTKLDNHLVQTEKWRNSSKNLFRLIDSSMSVRTKVGLGFTDCIRENNDKSLEVNTNDFAFSDSSVKSSEHKPTDSTSCVSTSSVSTSVNEAETESNVGTPIKEPIIVQDLPSFTCNSSDKNEHTSRTFCNKNGLARYIFLLLDHNHPTGKPKVKPVPTGKPKVTPVPTGKPKVTPVPTDKPQENPILTTADEGIFYSGCSRSMTGNKEPLDDFQAFQGGKVTFGGGEGRIARKGTIRTPTLVFENVYYVKELQ